MGGLMLNTMRGLMLNMLNGGVQHMMGVWEDEANMRSSWRDGPDMAAVFFIPI